MSDRTVNYQTIFVFLEVFDCEGGIQSYVQDILRAYISWGLPGKSEVFLLRDRPNAANPLENNNLKFHYFKTFHPQLGRLRLITALTWALWWHPPQQVICGHIKLAPLVQKLCQWRGIPYRILTYGKEVWEPLSTAEQKALQQADGISTISRYSRDRLCAAHHILPQRVQILPCAIDGNVFTPGAKSPELVERYGLAGAKVLMTVARLWSGDIYKGVDVTIRALPAIASIIPEVKYLVIGRGDDQPRLAKLAVEVGVADRVIFAGFVPATELVWHYRLADAYVMPSQEGFGIVYLEAMACGIPVLAGDDDGSADPLQDGKLGWQVPHRNPEAVAVACIEILKGEDRRCHGLWLREQVLHLFSQEVLRQKLQDCWTGIDLWLPN